MQQETISLSNWTLNFAEYTGFLVANPPVEQVRSAIANLVDRWLLSNLNYLDTEKLLEDALGLNAIVRIGKETIGWRTVSDRTEAEVLQIAYSSTEYSRARHLLGIDKYWLLVVNCELLDVYTRQDLYEAHMAAYDDLEDNQECIIVNL